MELCIAHNSCMSPCSSDFIISSEQGAWRKVSEDSGGDRSFLLIDCTVEFSLPLAVERRVPTDTQCFQHIAKFIYVTTTIEVVLNLLTLNSTFVDSTLAFTNAYSYGRRLPGLRSRASPCG